MRVLTEQQQQWTTSEAIDPEDLNRLYLTTRDTITDSAQKRWAKAPLSLPFVRDVGTPYTQALSAEERTYRFTCPVPCIVERAFLNAQMTATVAPAQWAITKVAGGATPNGVSAPWISTQGALVGSPGVRSDDGLIASSSLVQDINNDRFALDAGAEYAIALTGNTFSLDRGDLVMHVATDRWQSSGAVDVPSTTPILFNDSTARDATLVALNNTNATAAINKFASSSKFGMTPRLVVKHGFTNATSANILTFTIPRFAAARAQARIVRAYLYVHTAGATTVRARIFNEAAVLQATITAAVAGTQLSVDSGALNLDIDGGASENTAQDWSVVLDNSSATNCVKAQLLLWISWQ